jgi:NAD+ kinase
MSSSLSQPSSANVPARLPQRIGLLVHPTRNLDKPLGLLREWAQRHGVEIVQLVASYPHRAVAEPGEAADTDVIVSIGGDGTTLAALRAGAEARRPVLGVSCGSLGALATVMSGDIDRALDRFSQGHWRPRMFPALSIAHESGEPLFALNDVALVRDAGGQVRLTVHVDGSLFARIAGDGAVVSTPLGTSGYAISAGGPLLLTGVDGFVFTPLPKHGGFAPPLVIDSGSELVLDATDSYASARLEIDGQVAGSCVGSYAITFRPGVATQVTFDDQEPLLAGLRRRRILFDSPRFLAEADRTKGPNVTQPES